MVQTLGMSLTFHEIEPSVRKLCFLYSECSIFFIVGYALFKSAVAAQLSDKLRQWQLRSPSLVTLKEAVPSPHC